MDGIWAALAGLTVTLALEALAVAVAWGRNSEKLTELEKQVNNDVLGRKAIAAHGQTLAAMAEKIAAIHDRIHGLPCVAGSGCAPRKETRQ
ncbi:MAG TPA: hypothetical protein DCW68_06790 [Rhodospirillaceae bacterium]|nr:MAG: hypothetical protein A2018_01300 [Alphaproteobacteria bacterium GWF2_58_20]HAU29794.1 hypothetical protein [Rhodospirillaceae bacterium]